MEYLDTAGALDRALALTSDEGRIMLGIAGAPGSGKSTLARRIQSHLNAIGVSSVVAPMDGFHLSRATLDASGLLEVRGAPHTFDACGYVSLLSRIRQEQHDVWAPEFDRGVDDPVAGSILVPATTRFVITEGNYLLDDEAPWSSVADLLDEVWFVDVPDAVRQRRLIARHQRFGMSAEAASAHALGSDERNAQRVMATRHRADVAVDLG